LANTPNWGYTKVTDYETGYARISGQSSPKDWTDYTIEYYKAGSKTPYNKEIHCHLPSGMRPKFRTEIDSLSKKWPICKDFANAIYYAILSPKGKTVIRYTSNNQIVGKVRRDQYGNTYIKWEK